MSLVQEALRRKATEHPASGQPAPPPLNDKQPITITPPPPAPPTAAPASSPIPPQKKPKSGTMAGILLLVICIAAIAGAGYSGFYLYNYLVSNKKEPDKKPHIESPNPATAVSNPVSTAGKLIKKVKDIGDQEAQVYKESAAATDAQTPEPTLTPTAVPTSAPTPTKQANLNARTQQKHNTALKPIVMSQPLTSAPEPTPEPVEWPALKLSGVLATGSGRSGIAIINGTMVSLSNTVEGVRVLSIEESGVTLQLKNEQKKLRVGGEIY